MTEKRNARSVAATTERANPENEQLFNSTNCTTAPFVCQVSAHLLHGAENAIPARELAKLCGFRGTRALRLAVERERRSGALILSGDDGYFLPSQNVTQAVREVRRFVRRTDSRMMANRLSIRSCKRFLRRAERSQIDGQATFFESGGGN